MISFSVGPFSVVFLVAPGIGIRRTSRRQGGGIEVAAVMEEEKATQPAVAAEVFSDKEGHGSDGSPLVVSGSGREIQYGGWVYHLGVNTVGHEYCHLRFLVLRGTYIAMYKREPEEHPGIVSGMNS